MAAADDDARMRQLRLLCAQLSGDLTDPGGIAAFRRCLTSHDPLNEIRRDNNIAAPADRPDAAPPKGFGRDSRRHVAGNVAAFQAGEANVVYVLDGAGKLWHGMIDGKDAYLISEKVGAFRFVDGHLFIRGNDGMLWWLKPDGTKPTQVDHGVAGVQPLNAGLIYVLSADQTLWRETGDGAQRAEVDRTVKDFQAIDASVVYVLGTDGKLWREIGNMRTRTLIAGNIAAFQHVADGDTMYVMTADATLWRQSGSGKAEQVDQSVAAFQAIDAKTVFVLGKDGRLWRDNGGRGGAVLVDHDLLVRAGKSAFHADDPRHVYVLAGDHALWLEALP
jgi:hypothetical protein